jgi:hypothetical protein
MQGHLDHVARLQLKILVCIHLLPPAVALSHHDDLGLFGCAAYQLRLDQSGVLQLVFYALQS